MNGETNTEAENQVSEPLTQKVRRAMRTFSTLMQQDGHIAAFTVEAGAAYNELGTALTELLDAYEKQSQELWQMRADIKEQGKRVRFQAKIIERQRAAIDKLQEEVVLEQCNKEDVAEQAAKINEEGWQFRREATASERRAKEFQKAYESVASNQQAMERAYQEEIAELKKALEIAETRNNSIMEHCRMLEGNAQAAPQTLMVDGKEKVASAEQMSLLDQAGHILAEIETRQPKRDLDLIKKAVQAAQQLPEETQKLMSKAAQAHAGMDRPSMKEAIAKLQQPLEKCPRCESTKGYYTSNDGEKRCLVCLELWEVIQGPAQGSPA